MLYLIIAILSNTFMTFVMKISENNNNNRFNVNTINYLCGGFIAYFLIRKEKIFLFESNYKYAFVLAIINAIFYIACLYLMQANIEKNGAPLTATYNRLGLVIPILVSVFLFKEIPNIMQLVGCGLALFAIYYINQKKEKEINLNNNYYFLIGVFLVGGFVDTLAKIYSYYGDNLLQKHFIFYTFLFSFIFSLILSMRHIKKLTIKEIITGFCIGIPNQITTLAQLKAVSLLPAYFVFPSYSILVILLVNFFNIIIFREKLSKQQYIGTGIIILSLVFMNI